MTNLEAPEQRGIELASYGSTIAFCRKTTELSKIDRIRRGLSFRNRLSRFPTPKRFDRLSISRARNRPRDSTQDRYRFCAGPDSQIPPCGAMLRARRPLPDIAPRSEVGEAKQSAQRRGLRRQVRMSKDWDLVSGAAGLCRLGADVAVGHTLGENGCESARGLDADRRPKGLFSLGTAGSHHGSSAILVQIPWVHAA